MRRAWLAAAVLLLCAPLSRAHELRPAYLDLRELEPGRYAVLWKLPRQGGVRPFAQLKLIVSDDSQLVFAAGLRF